MLSGATSIASYSQSHNGPVTSYPSCINVRMVCSYVVYNYALCVHSMHVDSVLTSYIFVIIYRIHSVRRRSR